MGAAEELVVEQVPLDDLVLSDKNPRRGSVAQLVESMQEFGQHRPAVVQRDSKKVIVGNHMLQAATTLGWDTLAVVFVDDDDETALRRAIADNAVGDKASWDDEELAEVLAEIGPVPGFEQDDIDKILKEIEAEQSKPEPTYPLVARLNEHYDYVMVVCQTDTDWAWLQTRLQLRSEKSYKSTAVAKSHVLTVGRFAELLDEEIEYEDENGDEDSD